MTISFELPQELEQQIRTSGTAPSEAKRWEASRRPLRIWP